MFNALDGEGFYAFLFQQFLPSASSIDSLDYSIRDIELTGDLKMSKVGSFQQMDGLANRVFGQFGSSVAAACIIASLYFAPMQIFFASHPIQIASAIICAVIIDVIAVGLFGQWFTIKRSTYKTVDGIPLRDAHDQITIDVFHGLKNVSVLRMVASGRFIASYTSKIRYATRIIFNTRFPDFARQVRGNGIYFSGVSLTPTFSNALATKRRKRRISAFAMYRGKILRCLQVFTACATPFGYTRFSHWIKDYSFVNLVRAFDLPKTDQGLVLF